MTIFRTDHQVALMTVGMLVFIQSSGFRITPAIRCDRLGMRRPPAWCGTGQTPLSRGGHGNHLPALMANSALQTKCAGRLQDMWDVWSLRAAPNLQRTRILFLYYFTKMPADTLIVKHLQPKFATLL